MVRFEDETTSQSGLPFSFPKDEEQEKIDDVIRQVIETVKSVSTTTSSTSTSTTTTTTTELPFVSSTIKTMTEQLTPDLQATTLSSVVTDIIETNNDTISEMDLTTTQIFEANTEMNLVTEMIQTQTTNNDTILTEILNNNSTDSEGAFSTTTLATTIDDKINAITTTISDGLTTILPNNGTESGEESSHPDIEDKTMYIILGVMIGVIVLILILLIVIYKKYRLSKLRFRSRVYCVTNLKEVSVSNGSQKTLPSAHSC